MKSSIIRCLALGLLGLASCQKEYCWHCTTTSGQPGNPQVIKDEARCNETEKDIETYKLVNTYTTQVTEDSLIYTSTACVRN